jgi:hypothetical protein
LYLYKIRHGIPTWEEVLARIVPAGTVLAEETVTQ